MTKTYVPHAPLYKKVQYADLAGYLMTMREFQPAEVVDDFIRRMASHLISDNPDFSRERFYASAGYGGLGEIHQHRKSE